jgi:DNA-3-methyladenine glycosylase
VSSTANTTRWSGSARRSRAARERDRSLSRPLGRRFFARSSLEVARELLGCVLVVVRPDGRVGVRLTEVEAYDGESDPGSHAFRGPTPRNTVMYGAAGHLYVYFTYGMHYCANVVTGRPGQACAVLLRAGEVVEGVALARTRRPSATVDRDLARGPARLAQALGLGRPDNGVDLCAGLTGPDAPGQWVDRRRGPAAAGVRSGPRVGVSGAGGDGSVYPWRFWLDGDPTVSVYRPAKARVPRPQ